METPVQVLKIRAELSGSTLRCEIVISGEEDPELEYAFYINRNDRRIHTRWYQKSRLFDYDTGFVSGYYQVIGFVRGRGGAVQSAKSAPIFAHPIEIDEGAISVFGDEGSVYLLRGERWKFPAIFFPGEANSLFVLMPSAVDRAKVSLPVFSRWTWAAQGIFPGKVLCVADPTLELNRDLQLGWCLGSLENCATEELVKLVIMFARAQSIPRDRIVFYGSSAGGFAALALAARLDGSVAVAINAQTDALAYHVSKQVALVRQWCFSGWDEERIRDTFADRVNMISRWDNVGRSRVVLVQNELDEHHYSIHFKPFWESLGGGRAAMGICRAGKHVAWVYRDERGHVPETLEMARKIVSLI
ncbi:MAG: hypothetical protein KatS3mg122_1767 [Caldimonas sp.]|nr:MAG: hypothetical protein KatS3mg122_1767 [Caldimonas sp.]